MKKRNKSKKLTREQLRVAMIRESIKSNYEALKRLSQS